MSIMTKFRRYVRECSKINRYKIQYTHKLKFYYEISKNIILRNVSM